MGKRVLVVDDDPAVLELLRAALAGGGREVETAADGPRGLDALRARPPDLVLSDVRMPGMDGFEMLRRAREEGVRAPFLLISGAPDVGADSALRMCGTVGLLDKPLDVPALLRRVEGILASRGPEPPRPVLVADDDEAVRRLLHGFLSDAGYRVDAAADGAEAVERVRAAAEPYLFAFVDVEMPHLRGPEAIAGMTRLRPETLCIIMTGTALREEVRAAYREGGYTLLRKPFDLEAILRALPSYEAAAAERREAAARERDLEAQPAHRKALRWAKENVVAPKTGAGRSRRRVAAVCLVSAILAVVLLRAGTALHDRLQGEESRMGAFFERLEGYLGRGEAYLQRDEQRELGREGPGR